MCVTKVSRNAISVRLGENLASGLEQISQETQRPKSFHIKRAIESYLNEQADLEIALERLKNPADKSISLEQMRKDLDL